MDYIDSKQSVNYKQSQIMDDFRQHQMTHLIHIMSIWGSSLVSYANLFPSQGYCINSLTYDAFITGLAVCRFDDNTCATTQVQHCHLG